MRASPRRAELRRAVFASVIACVSASCGGTAPTVVMPECPPTLAPASTASEQEAPVRAPMRLDPRDVATFGGDALDGRGAAGAALVSQAPFSESIAALAASGDGRHLLAADARGTLALLDASTLEVRAVRTVLPAREHAIHLELDAGGTRALVALVSSDANVPSEVYAWDLASDALVRVLESRSDAFSPEALALAPNGATILAVEGGIGASRPREEVRVLEIAADGHERHELPGGSRLVAGVGYSRGLGKAYVLELDGGPPVHLDADGVGRRVDARARDDADLARVVAFRPGGAQVAVVDDAGALALCSPVSGTCDARVRWDGHVATDVTYGLGGDCVRLLDAEGAQAFVDARRGELVATLPAGGPARLFVLGACTGALVPESGGRLARVALDAQAARTLLPAPALEAIGLGDEDAVSLAVASENGRVLALAVDGALVSYDVALGASRAVQLVGVPGVVTDLAFSHRGDELFIRREGEVVRAGASTIASVPCPGHDDGRMLADGSMLFGEQTCTLYSALVSTELEGTLLAAATATATRGAGVLVASSPRGLDRVDASGRAATLWPAAELGCTPGPDCKPRAFLSSDGTLVVLRVGRAVRVLELASGRARASVDADPADELALTSDRRTLLVAHASGGLDAVDLRTGAPRTVLTDERVDFEAGSEVAHYVVTADDESGPKLFDARSHRETLVLGREVGELPRGRVVSYRGSIFVLGEGADAVVVDAVAARARRTRGEVLDAVRVGSNVLVAACVDDELAIVGMGARDPERRLASVGGCTRMRDVALRPDGGAVAVAVGDATLVVLLGGSLGPLYLRTQTDLNGTDWPVASVLGGSFSADDAVIEALRVRHAGALVAATIERASTSALRTASVLGPYFVPAPAPVPASPRPRGARP